MRPDYAAARPPRKSDAALIAAILALIAGKLWLIHSEDIIGSATQHDALWYVRSATRWYWGSPYDWTAFIRPCGYPIWIAVVQSLGIPLRLAIELLQIGGALVLILAFRAFGATRWVSCLSFAAICLHPAGFQLNDYTMSDTFYAALLWWLLGGLLLTLATRNWLIACGTGVAFAVLWNTREEGLLLVALIAFWLVMLWIQEKRQLGTAAKRGGLVLAIASVIVCCVYTGNYFRFHSFARSEMTARSFQSLFHSLLRIRPNDPKPYAPITNDTLHRAFAVSPTLAKLQKRLDGPLGEAWRLETFRQTGVANEIGAGWIVWAIRRAASEIGVFENPAKAQHFFRKAAREINAASDDGRLPTRFVIDGFLDPLAQSGGFARLPHSASRIARRIFAQWTMPPTGDDSSLTPEEAALYDDMTLRKTRGSLQNGALALAIENWIGRYHRVFQTVLHLLALVALVSLGIRWRDFACNRYTIVIVLLAAAILPRLAMFAWLDSTAFDSTQDRFLFPVLPLWSALLLMTIGKAAAMLPFSRRSRPETPAP